MVKTETDLSYLHQYRAFVEQWSTEFPDTAEFSGRTGYLVESSNTGLEHFSYPYCNNAEGYFIRFLLFYRDRSNDRENYPIPKLRATTFHILGSEGFEVVELDEPQEILLKLKIPDTPFGEPTGLVITPGPHQGIITSPAFCPEAEAYCQTMDQLEMYREHGLSVLAARRVHESFPKAWFELANSLVTE